MVVALEHDGRDDGDPFLALFHKAAEFAPRVEAGHARRVRALARNEHYVPEAVGVKAPGGSQIGGEGFAVAFIEKRRKRVEGVGRDLLECVGGHVVLLWTGCPWFLRALRNPTIRLDDTRLGHRLAEHRCVCHRACQRSVLARREAAGERSGVIAHRTTAGRWRSHRADVKYREWAGYRRPCGQASGCQQTSPKIYAAGAEAGAFPQADRLTGGGRSVRFGVPLQFAEERGGVDAELFGSVELVPAVALQDGEDVFAFDVVERAHAR